jgi:hypothetical protein
MRGAETPKRWVDAVPPPWHQNYSGPGNGDDNASAVAVSPDGTKIFVTGTSTGAGSGADLATVAYSQ